MNTTITAGEPPYSTADTGNKEVTIPYSLGFFLVILFILITLCYGSYIYKSYGTPARPPSRVLTTIDLGTTINHHHTDNGQHILTMSQGLGDYIIVSFPTFVYSEAMMPQKGDNTSTDVNNTGCSICLTDYKPTDVVRLLPECGHVFHVGCIDTWLKLHPTCPVCRNSPLPMF